MKQYLNRVKSVIPECLMHLILTVIVFFVFLYLCRIMWSLFTSTPVGRHHVEMFPERSGAILGIVSMDFVQLTAFTMGRSLKIGFWLSALAQFCHIQRRFFMPFGVAGRVLLWGLPVTYVVSGQVAGEYGIDLFALAFGVSLIPAVWGTLICFRLNAQLIPEAASAFEFVKDRLGDISQKRK